MDDPVYLVTRQELIEETVIHVLEAALEAAKLGKVSSVAIAGLNSEGEMWTDWSSAPSRVAQLGSIAYLQAEYASTARDET